MIEYNIQLKEITFQQIGGGYDTQYGRPFDISGRQQDIEATVNAIATDWIDGGVQHHANGANYYTGSASMISGAAGQLIAPSADAYAANIGLRGSGAWGDDRFIFWGIFETEDVSQMGYIFRYIVSGYTESDDGLGYASRGDRLDPRMKMFVNSIHKLQIQFVPDGYNGWVERCTVIHNDEVHTSNTPDFDLSHGSRVKDSLMRPVDILDMCQIVETQGSMSPYMQEGDRHYSIGNDTHIASMNRIGYGSNKLLLARADNLSSPELVNNLLGGISASRGTLERGAGSRLDQRHETDGADYKVYASAKSTSYCRESSMSLNGQAIMQLFRDRLHYREHPYIAYSEFLKVFPNADPRYNECTVGILPPNTYYDNSSDRMGGASKEQIEAFRIASSISNIMFHHGFREIKIVATNQTLNGQWDIRPMISNDRGLKNIRTTDTAVVMQYFRMFCDDLRDKVLIPATTVTGGYSRQMVVDIESDLMTDTRIVISLDGGTPCRQVFPVFASASYSPLRYRSTMGENDLRIMNTSAVVSQLADTVYDITTSRDYRSRDRTLTGDRTRPSQFLI